MLLIVLAAAAAVGLVAGAALRLKRSGAAEARQGGIRHPAPKPVLLPEGGFSMGSSRRKRWTRGAQNAPAKPRQRRSPDERDVEERLVAVEADETAAAPVAGDGTAGAEADVAADRSAGEEVDTILKTAREAAAKIRRSAVDEAEKVRADADTYAGQTRAEVDAYAQHVRSEAEREAEEVVATARARLAAADSEAKEKVRQAEGEARRRVESLEAVSKRHEERLQRLMVVFRGMTSQLQELLERPPSREQSGNKPADAERDEARQPDSARSRVA